jgi:hypothetical protein
MERLLTRWALFGACALLATAPRPAAALEYHALLDLRLVDSRGADSWAQGGLGTLRFDGDHDGLQLGQLSLALRQDFTDTLRLNLDAVAYGDHDRNPVDLTEAYLEWRPWPSQRWRSRARLGAFYPQISFENVLPSWRSPYSVSWSALDTWLGEEIRAIGAEYRLDWLGQRSGSALDVSGMVGVFGGNDPAGGLIAARGWALHDRQTTLFGRIGRPGGEVDIRKMFAEIDHRPGYYAGIESSWRDTATLRVMHYDNRGDRSSRAPSIGDISWQTLFDSAGLQLTPTDHLTVIAQYLRGETWIDPFIPFEWDFDAGFLMASVEQGRYRLTLRRDWFGMQQRRGFGANRETGSAWTAAALMNLDAHWSVAVEGLWVDSTLAYRRETNLPPRASERSLTLSLRYALDGALPAR